jgi:hypothetical protein
MMHKREYIKFQAANMFELEVYVERSHAKKGMNIFNLNEIFTTETTGMNTS